MSTIQSQVTRNQVNYGIEILDVRIGRTDLTEQVANNVYQRMRSEREKEANLLRAEGERNYQRKLKASANRQQNCNYCWS